MGKKLDTTATRHMTVPFQFKATADMEGFAGEFSGYAAGIHNIDRTGDMILPGAFTATLPDFLKEGVVCWQHNWDTPIGTCTAASEDEYGLLTTSRISNTAAGKDCMTLIKDGVIKKMSIGYRVQNYEWVDRAGLLSYLATAGLSDAKKASILTQFDEAGLDELFLLKQIKLYEYSPVSIPANPNAVITGAKGLPFADHSEAVLTAIQELSERVKAIHTLRKSQGKAANPVHVDQCHTMANGMDEMSACLRQMAADMVTPADDGKGARLWAEYLKLEASQMGAA